MIGVKERVNTAVSLPRDPEQRCNIVLPTSYCGFLNVNPLTVLIGPLFHNLSDLSVLMRIRKTSFAFLKNDCCYRTSEYCCVIVA